MTPRASTLQTDDHEAGLFLAEQVRIANLHWDGFAQAVLNIATNWDHGHQLGRLHAGLSAAEFITANVAVKDRRIVVPLLTESNLSHRQIAEVAGVNQSTVSRTAARLTTDANASVARLGRDGKTRRPPRPAGSDLPDEVWLEHNLRRIDRANEAAKELAVNWDEGLCVGRFYEGRTLRDVLIEKMPNLPIREIEEWLTLWGVA